jgi:hypothetical protein
MSLVYNNSLYIFPLCITGDHFPPFPNHDSGDPNTMEKLPSNNSFCASWEDTSFSDIALMPSEWSRFIWPLLSYSTGKQLLQWSCHLALLIHTKTNKQPPRHDISWTFRSWWQIQEQIFPRIYDIRIASLWKVFRLSIPKNLQISAKIPSRLDCCLVAILILIAC